MTDTPNATPWRVAPSSGFVVGDSTGSVPLTQIDGSRFVVGAPFSFDDPHATAQLMKRMRSDGVDDAAAQAAITDACTYVPSDDEPTDLASIPPFLRWFENTYGQHTLAAIIHDRLIRDEPNTGALGSDALSDLLFRLMLRSAGVAPFKRWIMWAAVTLRSRWVAGGLRFAAIVLWLLLAAVGITAFFSGVGTLLAGWPSIVGPGWLIGVAALLPVLSARLWGRQWMASSVAAMAALFILPATLLALAGTGAYRAVEFVIIRFSSD